MFYKLIQARLTLCKATGARAPSVGLRISSRGLSDELCLTDGVTLCELYGWQLRDVGHQHIHEDIITVLCVMNQGTQTISHGVCIQEQVVSET